MRYLIDIIRDMNQLMTENDLPIAHMKADHLLIEALELLGTHVPEVEDLVDSYNRLERNYS